jgi:tetratricopeptide (TPR) repeat protein
MRFALPVLMVCLLIPPSAFSEGVSKAGEKPGKAAQKEAQKHFDAGVQYFLEKDYAGAVEEFQKTYDILGHWAVRFNIATCWIELGRYADAIDELWLFLQEGGNQIEEARREEAMDLIEQAMKKAAKVIVSVGGEDARVIIDGKEVDWPGGGKPIYVNPGPHDIEVVKGDMVSWKSTVELKRGQVYTVEANPAEKAPVEKGGGKGEEKPEGGGTHPGKGIYIKSFKKYRFGEKEKPLGLLVKERKIKPMWFWISVGALGATALTATAMTIAAAVVKMDLDDLYREYARKEADGTADMAYYLWATARRQDLLDKGGLYTNVHAAFWIMAGFFAATTITLSIFTWGREKKGSVGVALLPLGCGAGISLQGAAY